MEAIQLEEEINNTNENETIIPINDETELFIHTDEEDEEDDDVCNFKLIYK